LIGVGTNDIYAVPALTVAAAANGDAIADTAAASSAAPSSVGVGLDLDVYLQGLTALPKELCRLCVNSVRVGNYALPKVISAFVNDLYSAFRLLNLRNDALRRKFDALKYDINRCDEILYDLKVRGLGEEKPTVPSGNAAAAAAAAAEINATTKPLAVADDVKME
jgi:hypothetical protein